jgi:EAL domain-containing protein (putative c-di-GMP-specific phosphodiesterase class I)
MNLIKMAHSLSVLVIAEGAETESEALTLKKINCDIIQGYVYGIPMNKEDIFLKIKKEGLSKIKS